jgi:hypothetical protein
VAPAIRGAPTTTTAHEAPMTTASTAAAPAPASPNHPLPAVGRVVLYVMGAYPGEEKAKGEIRPAMIVRTWGGTTVQLAVLRDGTNDGREPIEIKMPDLKGINDPDVVAALKQLHATLSEAAQRIADAASLVSWRTSVQHDQTTKRPGSWHWMDYQLGQAAKTVDEVGTLSARVARLEQAQLTGNTAEEAPHVPAAAEVPPAPASSPEA